MHVRSLLLVLPALALLAGTAQALPDFLEDVRDDLTLTWGGDVYVESADMDQSGTGEVLLRLSDDCPEDGCPWSLWAEVSGTWSEVATGRNADVGFLPTDPAGALLEADHVTWALQGGRLAPFGDVVSLALPRPPRSADIEAFRSLPGHGDVEREDMTSWSFPVMRSGEQAFIHVSVATSLDHMVGTWGTPYIVLDQEGALLVHGHSSDFPRIFPHHGEDGFTIVDVFPQGHGVIRFP